MMGWTPRREPPDPEHMALARLKAQYVHGSLELDELERHIEVVLADSAATLNVAFGRPDPMTPQTH